MSGTSAFEGIGRNTILLHEQVELFARNPPKFTPRYTKAFERSVVKTTNDRLLTDFTNLSCFACREDRFIGHGRNHPPCMTSRFQ